MAHDIKTLIGRLNFMGTQQSLMGTARKLALQTAKLARGPAAAMRAQVEGIMEIEAQVTAEAASWADPEAIMDGTPGPFDTCDLRHWLNLAERAGVPYIPAKQILSLTEDELEAIDQKIANPPHVARRIAKGMRDAFPEVTDEMISNEREKQKSKPDPRQISAQLYDAMDEVPLDWMVRSNLAGSSMLKALAGSGVIGDGREGSKLADGIEVGAGWVQQGNRRRIDATDGRFIDTFACGHKPEIHYLARPWMETSRRVTGEDPHRHGTPFAGKAEWPSEWRVFVTNGKITGVSSYYGWIGDITPENAYRALEAVDLAQKIVDEAKSIGAAPRLMDLELLRMGPRVDEPLSRQVLETWPADGVSCSLDFIETTDGMMLLEGGPTHTMLGGGHPCAFAGHNIQKETGLFCDCTGVALKMAEHVLMADPKTWRPGVSSDGVLSWEEARALAAQFNPEAEGSPSP